MRLKGKTALVTAAAAGIGKATALAYAKEGAHVIATDINLDGLKDIQSDGTAITIQQLDVTDSNAITAFAEEYKNIDILFNCAGFVHNGTILDCEEKDWDFSFDLNVKSCYRLIRALLPMMLERKNGSIINVASIASSVKGIPNRFVYGASKGAVIGLTKAIAADYVRSGIRCNAICPGTIDSPSLNDRLNAFPDPVAARQEFEERQPIGRLGTPEEIASLAVYLASDEAAYTTGSINIIDGGWIN